MKKDNVIVDKSFDFAVRIVKIYQHLNSEKKEFVLSKNSYEVEQASERTYPKQYEDNRKPTFMRS